MREISPFQAFNTIRLGVPGTAMAPFHSFSDREVWDLAFYIESLRHDTSGAALDETFINPSTLKQIATSSDATLESSLDEKDEPKRAALIAALRIHSNDNESGGSSLLIALADLYAAV